MHACNLIYFTYVYYIASITIVEKCILLLVNADIICKAVNQRRGEKCGL